VSLVIGTRPEAIKLASVAAALNNRGLSPTLIFTGQHPKLDPADYRLDSYASVRLDCPGQQDPHAHVGAVSKAMAAVLPRLSPQLVVVQGDTSSALGGALGARLASVPVAHVEAGLRSHDPHHPWPEEEFRVAIDRDSELLFAPTELSAANLRRERVSGRIHVTGNSGIDAVLRVRQGPDRRCATSTPRLLVTCHRRENWGGGVAGVVAALREIATEEIAAIDVILHPNPIVSSQVRAMLLGLKGIRFREPCTHRQTVEAMLNSDVLLSDSGGIQEEAAALGIPALVLREKTERPEAIASGNLELIGTDPARIVRAVRRLLGRTTRASAALPYGDGRAGERIAEIVEEWLRERGALSPASTAIPRIAYSSQF
jgi:UDP-N-acetylglucosamine 2-epimerase (non-hydrolysing)